MGKETNDGGFLKRTMRRYYPENYVALYGFDRAVAFYLTTKFIRDEGKREAIPCFNSMTRDELISAICAKHGGDERELNTLVDIARQRSQKRIESINCKTN